MQPDAERPVVRHGAPVVATALLVVVLVAMLAMTPGPAQTATLAVAVGVQFVVMVARGWANRAGRTADWSMRWHQFVFIWGATGGFVYLIGADRSRHAALVDLGQQLLVAIFVVGIVWLVERRGSRA